MIRRPPRSKRTATLFPSPTLFLSAARGVAQARDFVAGEAVEAAARVDAGVDGGQRGGARGRGGVVSGGHPVVCLVRSEEHTSELQSLMRISYAVFCL